jgi:hypothetical protein
MPNLLTLEDRKNQLSTPDITDIQLILLKRHYNSNLQQSLNTVHVVESNYKAFRNSKLLSGCDSNDPPKEE